MHPVLGEVNEAELLQTEAAAVGLVGPQAGAVSCARRRQALARVLWNVYEMDALHDPKPPLLEMVRTISTSAGRIRDAVQKLEDDAATLPGRSLRHPEDLTQDHVDALLAFMEEIAERVEAVDAAGTDRAVHREAAALLTRRLPLLRPFAQMPSEYVSQLVMDLQLLLLRWCARDRHVHLNLEMAGLAMLYMDRMLAAGGAALPPDADDATLLAWAATCTLLAARLERDDINRRLDASVYPYAALCGWARLPSEIARHSVDTLFFQVLERNANRQHVFRFLGLYGDKYLRAPGAWMAATYVATCLYLTKEVATLRPSVLAIQAAVFGAMLACPAPLPDLVAHARARVEGAESAEGVEGISLHTSLGRLRDVLLAERPCFPILRTLFGEYATMDARALAARWTDAEVARWVGAG